MVIGEPAHVVWRTVDWVAETTPERGKGEGSVLVHHNVVTTHRNAALCSSSITTVNEHAGGVR